MYCIYKNFNNRKGGAANNRHTRHMAEISVCYCLKKNSSVLLSNEPKKNGVKSFNIAISLVAFILKIDEPGHEKMCLMSYANNKGADQPAHPRSLISAFVVRCLDTIISL